MSFELAKASQPPPNAVPCGFQNDGAGTVWLAVAHTPQGNIPGKAKGNTCWYPYGGKETVASNFSYVVMKTGWRLEKFNGDTPGNAIACGNQTDGAGTVWGAVAHTPHGNIPGKAKGGNCWYPYGGNELSTNNFSWIVPRFSLVKSHIAPQNSIPCGMQNDGAGIVWLAVANTPHGTIPGKAIGNTCWYSYGGKETPTNDFSYVTSGPWKLEPNTNGTPPANAFPCGFQTDGFGTLWGAVAHTPYGNIPGKAAGNNCWYPYGGKETMTNSFSWVVLNQ